MKKQTFFYRRVYWLFEADALFEEFHLQIWRFMFGWRIKRKGL
ncbi:MAG: hypothetical protein ACYS7Y_30640 [Planctomycetota bacterium]